MKKISFLFALLLTVHLHAQDRVTISGQVTDFDGNPLEKANVFVQDIRFQLQYETLTDEKGYYELEVAPGEYASIYILKEELYPRSNAVPEEDMRLEFWAWNVIADRDLEINARYHRLELYGTTAFTIYGGYPGFFIYFRPMSLEKVLAEGKDTYLDKQKAEEKGTDISVGPEYLEVEIYADDIPLKINSVQLVTEYVGEGRGMGGYLVQIDKPALPMDKPYIIFRVVATNTEFGEKGENVYFYRIPEVFR
ncbi:MAG: carboxypeptidase-like regulatory domain-containing protein [Bacteroides sp.]|nr:carboxypeptidase-like regulatory domain-containing protein [Bacteroides sp.]